MEREILPTILKDGLRREARTRIRARSPEQRAEASLLICQTAAHLPEFTRAKCVALFAPLPSEPDIHPLIEEAWAEGKYVALPLMIRHATGPELDWHLVTSWDEVIMPGPFGLREPDPLQCPRLALAEIGCVFVPGLAIDDQGFRLGRGGGYYDYLLARTPPDLPCFGLMFACQRLAAVPREAHDRKLPALITEAGLTVF